MPNSKPRMIVPEEITPDALADAMLESKLARPNGKNIAVFGSTRTPKDRAYTQGARTLGRLIGDRGHNLVWGGTENGTMLTVTTTAKARGAFLLGVGFAAKDKPGLSRADRLFTSADLAQRKKGMLLLADVAIVAAGGLGTLDEMITVMLEQKHATGIQPLPPLVLLNTKGFFDGSVDQLVTMYREGFTDVRPDELVRVADTPAEAIGLAETLEPPQSQLAILDSMMGDWGDLDWGDYDPKDFLI